MRFISWFGRFHEDFPLKEGPVRVPIPFCRNQPENHSHNLGKALGEGLGLLCTPFTSLSLSPLSLSYLSLPLYISPSSFLSLSLLLSVFSLSFSLAYLMDVFVLVVSILCIGGKKQGQKFENWSKDLKVLKIIQNKSSLMWPLRSYFILWKN